MKAENGVYLNSLYAEYGALLTENQREIYELAFWSDLSLGEIAEIKGIKKQSVADALAVSRRQLETFEEKIGVVKLKEKLLKETAKLKDESEKINFERIIAGEN